MPIGNKLGDMLLELRDPNLSPQRQGEIIRLLNELGDREIKYNAWLDVKGNVDWKFIRPQLYIGVVRRAANQEIANSSFADPITFDTIYVDNENYFNLTTNPTRITIPRNGNYMMTISVGFLDNATGYRSAEIRKNGNVIPDEVSRILSVGAGIGTTVHLPFINADLTKGDYYEVYPWQNSGAPLNAIARVGIALLRDNN